MEVTDCKKGALVCLRPLNSFSSNVELVSALVCESESQGQACRLSISLATHAKNGAEEYMIAVWEGCLRGATWHDSFTCAFIRQDNLLEISFNAQKHLVIRYRGESSDGTICSLLCIFPYVDSGGKCYYRLNNDTTDSGNRHGADEGSDAHASAAALSERLSVLVERISAGRASRSAEAAGLAVSSSGSGSSGSNAEKDEAKALPHSASAAATTGAGASAQPSPSSSSLRSWRQPLAVDPSSPSSVVGQLTSYIGPQGRQRFENAVQRYARQAAACGDDLVYGGIEPRHREVLEAAETLLRIISLTDTTAEGREGLSRRDHRRTLLVRGLQLVEDAFVANAGEVARIRSQKEQADGAVTATATTTDDAASPDAAGAADGVSSGSGGGTVSASSVASTSPPLPSKLARSLQVASPRSRSSSFSSFLPPIPPQPSSAGKTSISGSGSDSTAQPPSAGAVDPIATYGSALNGSGVVYSGVTGGRFIPPLPSPSSSSSSATTSAESAAGAGYSVGVAGTFGGGPSFRGRGGGRGGGNFGRPLRQGISLVPPPPPPPLPQHLSPPIGGSGGGASRSGSFHSGSGSPHLFSQAHGGGAPPPPALSLSPTNNQQQHSDRRRSNSGHGANFHLNPNAAAGGGGHQGLLGSHSHASNTNNSNSPHGRRRSRNGSALSGGSYGEIYDVTGGGSGVTSGHSSGRNSFSHGSPPSTPGGGRRGGGGGHGGGGGGGGGSGSFDSEAHAMEMLSQAANVAGTAAIMATMAFAQSQRQQQQQQTQAAPAPLDGSGAAGGAVVPPHMHQHMGMTASASPYAPGAVQFQPSPLHPYSYGYGGAQQVAAMAAAYQHHTPAMTSSVPFTAAMVPQVLSPQQLHQLAVYQSYQAQLQQAMHQHQQQHQQQDYNNTQQPVSVDSDSNNTSNSSETSGAPTESVAAPPEISGDDTEEGSGSPAASAGGEGQA